MAVLAVIIVPITMLGLLLAMGRYEDLLFTREAKGSDQTRSAAFRQGAR